MPYREMDTLVLSAPMNVFVNVTSRCNLSCVYCCARSYYDSEVRELTLEEYRALAAQFDSLKVFRLILTGGEPLFREDFLEIVTLFKPDRRGITLNTNGTLIDRAVARQLKDLGLCQVAVSLDGGTEEVHAKSRGPGWFNRVLAGIEALRAEGVPTAVLCTVTRLNYTALQGVVMLGREYGVRNVVFNTVNPQGGAALRFAELFCDEDQRRWVAGQLLELRKTVYPYVTGDFLLFTFDRTPPLRSPTMLSCGAAKHACAITAEGWVMPCDKMPGIRCGNLRDADIKTIWNSEPMRRVRALSSQPVRLIDGCSDCRYVPYCTGGCRAEAYLATGSLYGRDPLCFAYSRATGGEAA